jgi:hypothetical protein
MPAPRLSCLLLLLPVCAGCGKGRADVSGRVTYKDAPVKYGTVTFFTAQGPRYGNLDTSGAYVIKDLAAASDMKVTVSSPNPKLDVTISREGKKGLPDLEAVKNWFPIPPEYGDALKTPLNYDVHSGDNRIDISLK